MPIARRPTPAIDRTAARTAERAEMPVKPTGPTGLKIAAPGVEDKGRARSRE
jgi:hypothetical protein